MSWVHMQRYRFRVVAGQTQVEKNATTGTLSVHAMCEAQNGPQDKQRLRFRGYLNSPANRETTIGELRAMGWRGQKFGDWAGLGSVEFEATAVSELGTDNKTYWRLAWPRPLATLKTDRVVDADALAALNAEMGGLLAKPADATKLPPPATPTDAGEGESGEIPF